MWYVWLTLLMVLIGCAGSSNGVLPQIPKEVPKPTTSSSSNVREPDRNRIVYTTSRGGQFYAAHTDQFQLSDYESLKGAASDSLSLYILTSLYVNYRATHWMIYRVPHEGNAQVECNFIDYGTLVGGLAFDGNIFYIQSSSSALQFRRFQRGGCAELAALSGKTSIGYEYNPQYAYDNGALYFPTAGGYYSSLRDSLLKFSASSMALISSQPILVQGTKSTDWSKSNKAITSVQGTQWAAFQSSSGNSWDLWRISERRDLVVGTIPSKDFGYQNIRYLAHVGPDRIVTISQNSYSSEAQFTYFNVSGF